MLETAIDYNMDIKMPVKDGFMESRDINYIQNNLNNLVKYNIKEASLNKKINYNTSEIVALISFTNKTNNKFARISI
jgi:hypothetical protein